VSERGRSAFSGPGVGQDSQQPRCGAVENGEKSGGDVHGRQVQRGERGKNEGEEKSGPKPPWEVSARAALGAIRIKQRGGKVWVEKGVKDGKKGPQTEKDGRRW